MPPRIPPAGGRAWRQAAVALWTATTLVACGGDGPNDPSPPPSQSITVSAITPAAGTTLGGTQVTITGTNFAAGAAVTIGGTAATDVSVQSATSLTARTPQHASGAADVIVTVGNRTGQLAGGYRFEAPAASTNPPPTISGITSRSARPGVPNRFADLDETITVTATVIDGETPSDQLKYEWSADSGAFSGTGREVTWRAPAQASTPAVVRLNLAVVETYQTTNSQGLPTTAENRVTGSVDVRLHASAKEVRDMAVEFLNEFSQQRVSPDQMVRNFTDSCPGKRAERGQVADNQATFTITSYSVDPNPPTDVAFGGVCRYRNITGDACAYVPVRWNSVYKSNGKPELAVGTDQVSAIYENNRWWLCDSDFIGTTSSGLRFRK
jgi:hypothetical protein